MSTLVELVNAVCDHEAFANESDDEGFNHSRQSLKRKADEQIDNLQEFAEQRSHHKFSSQSTLNIPNFDGSNYIALDCEMVETVKKENALARCTVVDFDGIILYDKFVKPYSQILDYRSRYSGVYPKHMETATPFSVAQRQIRGILSGKIVVGHSIGNDFASIGFSHPEDKVIDINKLQSVRNILGVADCGSPISLKRMTKALLQEDIQVGPHCSYEDAWATMRIFKVSLAPHLIKHEVFLEPPPNRRKNSYAGRKLSDQLMGRIRSQSASSAIRAKSPVKISFDSDLSKPTITSTNKMARRDIETKRNPKTSKKQKREAHQGHKKAAAVVKARPISCVYPIPKNHGTPKINYNKFLDDKYWL